MVLGFLSTAVAMGLIWCVAAIGVFFSYKVLDFADLTVDGSFATGGAVCAALCLAGVPPVLSCAIAFVAGLLCGLCTGLLHTALGIPPILSGILVQFALYSINLAIMGGASLATIGFDKVISNANDIQTVLYMLLIVTAIVGALYWLFGTQLGCSIRATGCNEHMARSQGINTNKTKVLGLAISNGLVALSGSLFALYNGNTSVTIGSGTIVTGLAAVIIGGVIVSKLPNNFAIQMIGVIMGAIVYYLAYQLAFEFDLINWLKLVAALIIIIFLAVPHFKQKYAKVKIPNDTLGEGGEHNA